MIVALAALVAALAMAALAVSLYALYGAQKLCHAARITMKTVREECAAAIEAAQTQYTVIASELESAKLQPAVEILPGAPRPSMNVTRRSQALRLHRKGDSAERIAATLEVPRQEIDLLLKVHQLVLNNL